MFRLLSKRLVFLNNICEVNQTFSNHLTKRDFSVGLLLYQHKMDLQNVCRALNEIAPVSLAEKWDNVGLLVEPTAPHNVSTILLTNDLTENVLEEAISISANLIVSYHPPIFKPFKKLTGKSWKERIIVKAIENRIAIYSPHTASDAVENGANEWLSRSLGELSKCVPIRESCISVHDCKDVSFTICESAEYKINEVLDSFQLIFKGTNTKIDNFEEYYTVSMQCNGLMLSNVVNFCHKKYPNNCADFKIINIAEQPIPFNGSGRICTIKFPCTLLSIVERVKKYINVPHIRLAVGKDMDVNTQCSTVAICPGSGSSVIGGVNADVYLTGEMSHHEILDATSAGRSVILCEHSNSERGYLFVIKTILEDLLGNNVHIFISELDRDPIEII